jgi:hypothetical protein
VAAVVTSFQSPVRPRTRGGLVAILLSFMEVMVVLDPTVHSGLIADRAQRRS